VLSQGQLEERHLAAQGEVGIAGDVGPILVPDSVYAVAEGDVGASLSRSARLTALAWRESI